MDSFFAFLLLGGFCSFIYCFSRFCKILPASGWPAFLAGGMIIILLTVLFLEQLAENIWAGRIICGKNFYVSQKGASRVFHSKEVLEEHLVSKGAKIEKPSCSEFYIQLDFSSFSGKVYCELKNKNGLTLGCFWEKEGALSVWPDALTFKIASSIHRFYQNKNLIEAI